MTHFTQALIAAAAQDRVRAAGTARSRRLAAVARAERRAARLSPAFELRAAHA
jgi:hypothetical protein